MATSKTEYTLTDAEWADSLRVAFDAAFRTRFVEGDTEAAGEVGVQAGIARAQEIARRRVLGG